MEVLLTEGNRMRFLPLVLMLILMSCAAGPDLGLLRNAAFQGPGKPSPEAAAYAHYLTAVIHKRNGRFEDWAEEMRKAHELVPESQPLTLKLIQAYIQLRDYRNASEMCRQALEQAPDDVRLWTLLGITYQHQDQYQEAVQAFQEALNRNPESVLSQQGLELALESTHDYVGSVEIYENLVELRPDVAALQWRLGRALARIDDSEAARAHIERALELDPSLNDARYLLGLVYLDTGENQKAIDLLEQYLGKEPMDDSAQVYLAGAYARVGNRDQAIDILSKLIEDEKAAPNQQVERMYLLLRAGRNDEAAALTPPAAPITGTLLRVLARKHQGQPYRPILETLDEVDGDPDLEFEEYIQDLLYLFGEEEVGSYLGLELEALREEGISALRLDLILSRLLMSVGHAEKAEPILLDAVRNHGPSISVHYALASIYEERGDIEGAEQQLRACIEINANDPDVLNFLGYMYAEANIKLDEAEALLVRALEMDPDNPFYLDSLGWVYYRKGDVDKAIELIRKAIVGIQGDDAVLRDHLGDAYLLKGETQKAVSEWKRARRLDPDLEGLEEKLNTYQNARRE
jgi:tetratricopeptide (TPR) repeat protein